MDFVNDARIHMVGRHRHFFRSSVLLCASNDVRVARVLVLVVGGGVKSTTQGRDATVDDVPARDDDTFP